MQSTDKQQFLFPLDPESFWIKLRNIVQEEISRSAGVEAPKTVEFQTPGLKYKPLYKISEVCILLGVSRPTIYQWVRHGKLKPYKIRSRVYFLWNDLLEILQIDSTSIKI